MNDGDDVAAEVAKFLAGSFALNNTSAPAHGSVTETTLAARLIRDHGHNLRFVDQWKRWLHYQDGRWQNDERLTIEKLVKDTLQRTLRDIHDIIDDKTRQKAVREIVAHERISHIRGTAAVAASDVPATSDQLDADPWLFNVRNGTINLRTGLLQPHNRDDLITKQSPVDYQPDAQCPVFHTYLQRIQPDPEVRHFLRRAIGYTLTGSNTEQILLVLYGHGMNGKSTFVETMLELFGDYGQQAPTETFLDTRDGGIPNDIARMIGTRFVAASESGAGRKLNETLVKRMTGGDTLTARFMRSEFFEFQPQFTPWLSTNHRPEIRGTDHAIWRRIKLIPFNIEIPYDQRDEKLKDKLRTEFPGILAWAIRGCRDWQTDGLQEPDSVQAATNAYRDDMDTIQGFLDDHTTPQDDWNEPAPGLYRAYNDWAKTNGLTPISAKALTQRLTEKGYEQHRTPKARMWKNLRLLTNQEDLF